MPQSRTRYLKKWVLKFLYIGEFIGDSKRATVMFEGPENVLYNIFISPKTKPIVEASGHIYEETKITRWKNNCPNC